MTPETWRRLKPLFEAAVELPAIERAGFADVACGKDELLRKELKALLRAHELSTNALDAPLVASLHPPIFEDALLDSGHLLLGRFEVVRHLGSGGMGDVYEAVDRDLGRGHGRIALKTVRRSIAEDPAALARFKEEVVLARRVSGPHVCRIHELFMPSNGSVSECSAFLTMEYLEGTTLADRLATLPAAAEIGMPLREAATIAAQLCEALESIHKAGVIHRDLKPRNIMLIKPGGQPGQDTSERVVVMDFGLARVRSRGAPDAETGLTLPGMVMGTPDYMAPEQLEGKEASPATDIYALGLILYELVTGRQPFSVSTPFGMAVRRGRRPDSPSRIRKGVPPVWEDVICKCIEADPERRYQSAREVATALSEVRWDFVRLRSGAHLSLNRRSLLAVAAVLFVLLTVSGWSSYKHMRIHRPPPEAQRWYDEGVVALRDNTYLKAANSLEMAVKLDGNFALAHARLAESWAELDSTGKAQEEMLLATAPEQQNTVPEEDRRYIDAVRATLIRDYSAAAQDYERILEDLPEGQKADGLVDLGRAYERAGKIKETIASYERAAEKRPNDPAAFVHLGIWKSRQRDATGAEAAFHQAEDLYKAKSNQEGLAEVAYQRGYAANEVADSQHARQFLQKSLDIARQIDNPQLEARSLTQLSSVEYNDDKNDTAIEYANRAIQLAQEKGLEYWSTDGLMRLGNAYLGKEDYLDAEKYTRLSLGLAQQNRHPRIEADCDFTLSSVRDQSPVLPGDERSSSQQDARQRGRDEEISFAREALKYYRDYGFMNAAATSEVLIIRGEEGKGDYAQALQSGEELIRLATKTNSQVSLENAEEVTGFAAASLEDFPSALGHFQKALQASRSLHENEAYHEVYCADMLWQLGRYREAQDLLDSIPAEAKERSDIRSNLAGTTVRMYLSDGRFKEALKLSQKILDGLPKGSLGSDSATDFEAVKARAEGKLSQIKAARQDADRLLLEAKANKDEGLIAQAELIEAEVYLESHLPEAARSYAESANTYFTAKNQKQSEWLSLFELSEALKASGEITQSKVEGKKALDILTGLEQSWTLPVFAQYTTRPDLQLAMQELRSIQTL